MPHHPALDALARLPRKKDGKVLIGALNKLVPAYANDHALAVQLWDSGDAAARQLAVRIADPARADDALLERWVADLADWDLTDAFTGHYVRHTDLATAKARAWATRAGAFERRAGFATVAQMAWSKNDVGDPVFIGFLPLIEDAATDGRFYVKKAVNWALRDIGKRNEVLLGHAQATALRLQASPNKTARWVGTHRAKELFRG